MFLPPPTLQKSSLLPISAVILLVLSPTAWCVAGTNILFAGQSLTSGQYLTLPDGKRILEMQADGNLVLKGMEVRRLLWQSGTAGHPGAYYTMQGDGNLVVYSTNHVALWSSKTVGNPGSTLAMQDDGNLVIYSPPQSVPLWTSGTGGNPGASYVMQGDGNMVVYSTNHVALWSSKTWDNPGATNFLDDGNLGIVSQPKTNVVWATGTEGNPGAKLEFVNGALTVSGTNGGVLWHSPWCNYPSTWWEFTANGDLQVWAANEEIEIIWWDSGTAGMPNPELVMQDDGNLVIKAIASTVLWQTGTGGQPGAELVMHDDGNLVVDSAPAPQLLWSSRTAGNPGAELIMRPDGNLIILGPTTRRAVWATGTYGNPGSEVSMQADGNLVVYSPAGTALWSSGTGGQWPANPYLKLQSDGNLVVYFNQTPKWAIGTFVPWMEQLGTSIADFSLRKLVIPGSHDSGTWGLDDRFWADDGNVPETVFDVDGYLPWHVEVHGQWVKHHTSWWPHIAYWTYDVTLTPHAEYMHSFSQTQSHDFSFQLDNGIRYFDMRVLCDQGGLYLIHTLRGPSVFDEIDEVNAYLRENPFEIVILDFQHFYTQGGSGSSIPDDSNAQLIDYIQHRLGDLLIPPPDDVNQLTVGNVWASGKQVIVFYAQNPPAGVDTSLFWSRDNKLRSNWLNQQSLYAGGGKEGLAQAIEDEAACVVNLQSGCGDAAGKLWVLQGILTFEPGTLENYAADGDWGDLLTWLNGNRGAAASVNGWVQSWVRTDAYGSQVNILLGDWTEDSQLVKTAVAANLAKAGLDPLHPGIEGLPLFDIGPNSVPQTPEEATASTIPVVVPPSDLRIEATGLRTPVKLGASTAYDSIDGWLECESDAAPSYPIGEHQIVWTAWDGAGVVGTATQAVWIVALRPQAETTNLWPANDKMVWVTIDANVVPALRGLVTFSASVASSDPQAGKGSDWTEPQIDQASGTIRVELRAERRGGVDRLYAITVTATDAEGNADHEVVQVTVTAGLTLFADTFEDSHPATNIVEFPPYQGTRFLEINRQPGQGPNLFAAIGDAFTSDAADEISIRFAIRVDTGEVSVYPRDPMQDTGQIGFFADGRVGIVDHTGKNWQFLTQVLRPGAWNSVAVNYVNGSGTWSVSINGGAAESKSGMGSDGGAFGLNVAGFKLKCDADGIGYLDAFALTNETKGTLMFAANFDNGTVGEAPAATDPQMGTWSCITDPVGLITLNSVSHEEVTNAAPNAPQVGSYGTATALVTTAAAHGGTKSAYLYPALGEGEMRPRFITPVPRDFKLHVETWLDCVAQSMHFGLDTVADNLFAMVMLQPDGTITVFSGTNNVDTGLRYSAGTWEKYQIDYVVGSDELVLTLNDQSVTAMVPVQNEIRGLWFVCGLPGDDFQSRGFVDDVVAETPVTPEIPPTLTWVRTGNQLTLSWIGTGYTLQENEAVPNPTGWKNIGTGSPTTVTVGAGNKFYRLNK